LAEYEYIKNTKLLRDVDTFKDSLTLITSSPNSKTNVVVDANIDFADMCNNSKFYAILIQHIKTAKDMDAMQDLLNDQDTHAIMAQVYFALGQLTDEFVHYDLHTHNVLLYEPVPGKYLEFHYHFDDGSVVSFKSKYVAKIIDYGRSYIKESPKIHEKICDTEDCDPRCGWGYGFNWMTTEDETGPDEFFISSALHNPSHDLRFFYNMYPNFEMLTYGEGIDDEDDKFNGTEANFDRGYPNTINNVKDASDYLQQYMSELTQYYEGPKWPKNKKYADLHVYVNMNKIMQLVKV